MLTYFYLVSSNPKVVCAEYVHKRKQQKSVADCKVNSLRYEVYPRRSGFSSFQNVFLPNCHFKQQNHYDTWDSGCQIQDNRVFVFTNKTCICLFSQTKPLQFPLIASYKISYCVRWNSRHSSERKTTQLAIKIKRLKSSIKTKKKKKRKTLNQN